MAAHHALLTETENLKRLLTEALIAHWMGHTKLTDARYVPGHSEWEAETRAILAIAPSSRST